MARLMSPNNGETAVHGCHCPGDMAVRMREVLARALVGVCVSPALSLSYLALLAWGDVFPRFAIPEEKWGLLVVYARGAPNAEPHRKGGLVHPSRSNLFRF